MLIRRTLEASDEVYVLNCMLEGKDCLEEANTLLDFEDFTGANKEIFRLILDTYILAGQVDMVSFYRENSAKIKELDINWTEFTNVLPSTAHFAATAKRLKEATKKRKLITLMREMKAGLEEDLGVDQLLAKLENYLLNNEPRIDREYLSPRELWEKCRMAVVERMNEEKRLKKVTYTGFRRLNMVTGGFEAGDLIILSAETGGGKSAFAANLAKDIGIVQKQPVLYVNSEMSAEQMALRWCALLSGVSLTDLRNGEISDAEHAQITENIAAISNSELHTATIPDLKISSIISEIKRAKRRHDIRMAIVDYIGRVDMENAGKEDWQMMTMAARKLKTLAQKENIIILMVAQLSANGRLAQASYMAHEADLWFNLRKPTDDEAKKEDLPWWNIFLEIKKGRNTQTGILKMHFEGAKMRFSDNAGGAG